MSTGGLEVEREVVLPADRRRGCELAVRGGPKVCARACLGLAGYWLRAPRAARSAPPPRRAARREAGKDEVDTRQAQARGQTRPRRPLWRRGHQPPGIRSRASSRTGSLARKHRWRETRPRAGRRCVIGASSAGSQRRSAPTRRARGTGTSTTPSSRARAKAGSGAGSLSAWVIHTRPRREGRTPSRRCTAKPASAAPCSKATISPGNAHRRGWTRTTWPSRRAGVMQAPRTTTWNVAGAPARPGSRRSSATAARCSTDSAAAGRTMSRSLAARSRGLQVALGGERRGRPEDGR
jgi:hypothetical protein